MQPEPMGRNFDHIVIAGHDLAAVTDFYRRIGFQVGRRNIHPWGTENHIIQFDGVFLELIGLPPAGRVLTDPVPYFANFIRNYLAKREGLAMLVLASKDAKSDYEDFKARDIGLGDLFDFVRQARTADGKDIHVAFTLAFAHPNVSMDCGFFTCQQHYPENFWNSVFQVHSNGVITLYEVIFASDRPEIHRSFLADFIGSEVIRAENEIIVFGNDRQRTIIAHPDRLMRDYGIKIETAQMHMVALSFSVRNIAHFKLQLQSQCVAYSIFADKVVIAAETAFGAFLVFAQI